MESRLESLIKRLIDEGLKIERLRELYKGFDDFSLYIKSKEDMLFGYFIGNVYGHLFYFTQLLYQREPTIEERSWITIITLKRAEEIKAKISAISKERT